MNEDEKKPLLVVPAEPLKLRVRRTLTTACKDSAIHILKNPKWLLEWMLVILVMKLLLKDGFDFRALKELLK